MTYPEIHIWGDSLARGIIYNEQRKRYAISRERCTARLQAAAGCRVVDHSMMGATVEDGLAGFASTPAVEGALCVIEFGGNDCDLNWPEVAERPDAIYEGKVPLESYRALLDSFVSAVRERGMDALLVTPLPLHARRYFDWVTRGLDEQRVLRALGDVDHIYRWQERYTIAMRAVAAQRGCPLLDIRDVFLAQPDYESLMCIDGIHPNDAGHRLIADAAIAALAGLRQDALRGRTG